MLSYLACVSLLLTYFTIIFIVVGIYYLILGRMLTFLYHECFFVCMISYSQFLLCSPYSLCYIWDGS